MKTLLLLITLLFTASFAQAQTGWGSQAYIIVAGSETSGYPIVTAVVPVGSYIVTFGSTIFTDGSGQHHVAILTYIVPVSPDPQPTETHLFIAGVCQGIKAPSGYRKISTYRNIYGIDNPDTGYDNTNEYCVLEIQPR